MHNEFISKIYDWIKRNNSKTSTKIKLDNIDANCLTCTIPGYNENEFLLDVSQENDIVCLILHGNSLKYTVTATADLRNVKSADSKYELIRSILRYNTDCLRFPRLDDKCDAFVDCVLLLKTVCKTNYHIEYFTNSIEDFFIDISKESFEKEDFISILSGHIERFVIEKRFVNKDIVMKYYMFHDIYTGETIPSIEEDDLLKLIKNRIVPYEV